MRNVVIIATIIVLSVVFALQNADVVTVQFLFWEFPQSLALILIIVLMFGALMGYLIRVLTTARNPFLRKQDQNSANYQSNDIDKKL